MKQHLKTYFFDFLHIKVVKTHIQDVKKLMMKILEIFSLNNYKTRMSHDKMMFDAPVQSKMFLNLGNVAMLHFY